MFAIKLNATSNLENFIFLLLWLVITKICLGANFGLDSYTNGTISDLREDCPSESVYDREDNTCWLISNWMFPLSIYDVQCVEPSWENHSRCSISRGKCRCFSSNTTVDYDDAMLVDGGCYPKPKKTIRDFCQEDNDCTAAIKGDVYCKRANDPDFICSTSTNKGINTTGKGTCRCRDTHFWHSRMKECLRKSTGIKDKCIVSRQCNYAGIGKYSRCSPKTNQCECYGGAQMQNGIVYYNVTKKCFPRRMVNEACEDNDECRASLGPKGKCGTNEEHPDKMVCHYYDGDGHSPLHEERWSGYPIAVIVGVGAVIGTLAILGIVLVEYVLVRRSRSRMEKRKNRRVEKKMKEDAAVESLFPGQSVLKDICAKHSIIIYSTEDITSMSLVGEGFFGQVFKGTLNGAYIAVKEIKSDLHSDTIREMETVAKFSHPNILSLVGIAKNSVTSTVAPQTIWLLFEFMELGDLAKVLKNDRFKQYSSLSDNDIIVEVDSESSISQLRLTSDTLLSISSQIAKGMLYHSSRHFVHRDLAARNCLVGATGVVKIADFGLSRDVYASHYYRGKGDTPLPIRWMAPESITHLYFTIESDVWAYGILLWEIYSWGMLPYYSLTDREVMEQIKNIVLPPPDDCPVYIMELMSGCLKREPKSRLTFRQICDALAALLPNSSGASSSSNNNAST